VKQRQHRRRIGPWRWPRRAALLLLAMGLLLASARIAMGLGWLRGPYPPLGRSLAWALGVPAAAYNFAVVEEGRLFRSARPDARFLEWLQRTHGVARVVGLDGRDPVHEVAASLGMEVFTWAWRTGQLPEPQELDAVVALLADSGPLLVHCASGSDRTGYAVAAFRVERMNWSPERAVAEMERHWHTPERHPELHAELRARFAALPR
jgi:hypothetical protein